MADLIESKPLSGFQDVLPADALAFEEAVDRLKRVFRSFGYAPIDTPCIYRFETLTGGKAGIDKQLFEWHKKEGGKAESDTGTHVALRFDLTVPLARYVAANFGQLTFPFKRYDVGKVWRGERPQKGRYREFYQCDFDLVGTTAPSADLEVALVMHDAVLAAGGERFQIRINERRILNGMLEALGLLERGPDVLRAVDKQDKIGADGVLAELTASPDAAEKPGLGIAEAAARQVLEFTGLSAALEGEALLADLGRRFAGNARALDGVARLAFTYRGAAALRPAERFAIDLSIARGLGYYTGIVYETVLTDAPKYGSVCSGGRYDDLASFYIAQRLPGVGASVGLSRLLAALAESKPEARPESPCAVLIATAPEVDPFQGLRVADLLRSAGIGAESFPQGTGDDEAKLKKQFKYADARGSRLVVLVAPDELARGAVVLKDMRAGAQEEVALELLPDAVRARLR